MPELPEVETVKRGLQPKLLNKTVQSFHINRMSLINNKEKEEFISHMQGFTFRDVYRRAKLLIFEGIKDGVPIYFTSHLKMTGAWFYLDKWEDIGSIPFNYRKHTHIIYMFTDGTYLIYSDIRKFGKLQSYEVKNMNDIPELKAYGPEPFQEDVEIVFTEKVRNRKKRGIKDILMDQVCIAGVGNIYACEVLFEEKIHPLTVSDQLTDIQIAKLLSSLQIMLQRSIDLGGSSFSDYVNSEGQKGNFQDTFQVYQQKECKKCGTEIEKIIVKQRTTHFCPKCQSMKGA